MPTIDFQKKVRELREQQYEWLVHTIPLEYAIFVKRTKPTLGKGQAWDESIEWAVDDELLDHEFGETVMFNNLLSIIDTLAHSEPRYMVAFKEYIADQFGIGEPDDSHFNK